MKFVVLKFKHILQISPWRFWFFSNEVPGWDSEKGREGRDVSRQWGWPAARGKWGERERGSRATLGWSWEERRWSELGSPRRGADGGVSGRRRRCSSGGRRERTGL